MFFRRLAVGLICLLDRTQVNANPIASNETAIDNLVLVSAYFFPNQSSLDSAVKDSSWQRYDNADASSYWSTGKQEIKNSDVSIVTYAYSADNLDRRNDNDKKKKKHRYLGYLGVVPGLGGAWVIGDQIYKLIHGAKPTGVNVAGPSISTHPGPPNIGPPNTIPPNILKPGPLTDIITTHPWHTNRSGKFATCEATDYDSRKHANQTAAGYHVGFS